jgi:hypothetical protein
MPANDRQAVLQPTRRSWHTKLYQSNLVTARAVHEVISRRFAPRSTIMQNEGFDRGLVGVSLPSQGEARDHRRPSRHSRSRSGRFRPDPPAGTAQGTGADQPLRAQRRYWKATTSDIIDKPTISRKLEREARVRRLNRRVACNFRLVRAGCQRNCTLREALRRSSWLFGSAWNLRLGKFDACSGRAFTPTGNTMNRG